MIDISDVDHTVAVDIAWVVPPTLWLIIIDELDARNVERVVLPRGWRVHGQIDVDQSQRIDALVGGIAPLLGEQSIGQLIAVDGGLLDIVENL